MVLATICEGCGDVVGVLTLLVGGVAQAFHDDRVVKLRVQLGVEEVDGEGQERTGRSRKREASQRGAPKDMTVDDRVFAQSVDQSALRARENARCAPRNCRSQHRHWCRAW